MARRPRTGAVLVGVLAAVAGAGAGLLVIAATGQYDGWPFDDGGSGGTSASGPRVSDPAPVAAPSVLPVAATTAPLPSTTGLARALAGPLDAAVLGTRIGVVVADPVTGTTLFSRSAATDQIPASTAKLVTAASALHHLGPDARLTTRTVRGAAADQVFLIGGGDPALSAGSSSGYPKPASLTDLARQTATALKAEGRTSVELLLDDSRFTGPRTAPGWLPADVASGIVTRVSALTLDRPMVPLRPGPKDPTLATGAVFARALEKAGIEVRSTERGVAPATGTTPLGAVQSPPVSALVERMLLESNNDIAEALARSAGVAAGIGGSFADGSAAAEATLTWLGLDPEAATLVDGSGLSLRDELRADLLGNLVATTVRGTHPELAALLSGLPTAGVDGSLGPRFDTPPAQAARGFVRAKTGTLTGVNGLAGTVVDRDGRTLVLVVLADRTSSDTFAVRTALDRVAAAVQRCGCR